MEVIGAGFPRTGTTSMKVALEQLGFGPCHHMEELFKHHEQIPVWLDVADGKRSDWEVVLRGYRSCVDFPSQHWYRELLARWPEAKVILTLREEEGWYRSFRETIYAIGNDIPMRWVGRLVPVAGGVTRLADRIMWDGLYGGRFLDKAHALGIYRRHIEEVKAHVPPEQLLVFDVKEGWGPLCVFLGVPVPTTPFPRLNDSAAFQKRITAMKVVGWAMILSPVVTALVVAGIFWR